MPKHKESASSSGFRPGANTRKCDPHHVSGPARNWRRVVYLASLAYRARHTEALFGGPQKAAKNPKDYHSVDGVLIRAAGAPFVEGVIAELAAEEAERQADLQRNVPGLELRTVHNDEARYRRQFEQMTADESNDGARPPEIITIRASELSKRYPIAAAYLKADDWDAASYYAKSSAGRKVKARIAAGEDYQTVLITEMQAAWWAHVRAHAFD